MSMLFLLITLILVNCNSGEWKTVGGWEMSVKAGQSCGFTASGLKMGKYQSLISGAKAFCTGGKKSTGTFRCENKNLQVLCK